MEEAYEESELVTVHKEDSNAYLVTMKSKKTLPFEGQSTDTETEEVEEEVVKETFSPEFLEYNHTYYTGFKNQVDLIASNFE